VEKHCEEIFDALSVIYGAKSQAIGSPHMLLVRNNHIPFSPLLQELCTK
jgi:hypothetical protein